MIGALRSESGIASYALEIEIDAAPQRVWTALIDEIDAWWLPDFHMVDPASTVRFDARAGGGIIETSPDGSSLLWYTVTLVQPQQHTVHLVGHVAPDWGGPACTHLKLAVEARGSGSVLKVDDAHVGHISEQNLTSLHDGWKRLFGDGLRAFVARSPG